MSVIDSLDLLNRNLQNNKVLHQVRFVSGYPCSLSFVHPSEPTAVVGHNVHVSLARHRHAPVRYALEQQARARLAFGIRSRGRQAPQARRLFTQSRRPLRPQAQKVGTNRAVSPQFAISSRLGRRTTILPGRTGAGGRHAWPPDSWTTHSLPSLTQSNCARVTLRGRRIVSYTSPMSLRYSSSA